MIKSFTPRPYNGLDVLPDYVTDIRRYTLVGNVPEGYTATLARLTVGNSKSAGNPLAHVLFESFDDHGRRMKTSRIRTGGIDREFVAVKNAMSVAGVEFNPSPPCTSEAIIQALGKWFMTQNSEISAVAVVVQ